RRRRHRAEGAQCRVAGGDRRADRAYGRRAHRRGLHRRPRAPRRRACGARAARRLAERSAGSHLRHVARIIVSEMRGLAAIVVTAFAAIAAVLAFRSDAAPLAVPRFAQGTTMTVDTELVLAVDVSYSMDPDEQ